MGVKHRAGGVLQMEKFNCREFSHIYCSAE